MTEIHDHRLHEALVAADLEDMKLLHREVSAYLEFWRIVEEQDKAGRRRGRRLVDQPR